MTTDPEPDYTPYASKRPTPLQERFPEWLTDKTGYDPSAAKSKQEAFENGVRLATSLRMQFQASPENRAATLALRNSRAAEAEAVPETPATASAPKPRGRPKSQPVPAPVAEVPAAPPARGRRRAAASASPAAF